MQCRRHWRISCIGNCIPDCKEKRRAVPIIMVSTAFLTSVFLIAMLCGKFWLDPLADGVIVSHAEGHKRGIASNHGDSEHLWRQLGLPYSMDGVRRDVKDAVSVADGGGMANGDCPFLVKVSIPDLNIRKGAGTNTGKTGRHTGVGVFTVVEVRQGKGSEMSWGRLKSGAGWIALSFCERV